MATACGYEQECGAQNINMTSQNKIDKQDDLRREHVPRFLRQASADPAVRELFSQVGSYESRYVLQTGRPLRRTAKFDLIAAKDLETNRSVVVKTMREASHHARELDARGWEQHGGEWSPPPSDRALSSAYVSAGMVIRIHHCAGLSVLTA